MKVEEKKQAIEMRRSGKSLKEIATTLKVSKGTVSVWVRDVELTEDQKTRLELKAEIHGREAFRSCADRAAKNRDMWRRDGELLVDNLHAVAAALLYWGEGHKRNNRNSICFANSDVSMIHAFIFSLINGMSLDKKDVRLYLNIYTDVHSREEIIDYWLSELSIDATQLRSITENNTSRISSGKRKSLCEWGTARVCIHSTHMLHLLYGVIDAYSERCGYKTDCTNSFYNINQ